MKQLSVFLISLVLISLLSCNNETSTTAAVTPAVDTTKPVENKVMIPESGCYTGMMGRDSFDLKVEKFPNVVTGNLVYRFHDKDSNKGTIDGKLHGDTLIATYHFMSEGKQSVRQVAFLIKDNTATEGYGSMEEKNGEIVFKDLSAISFKKGIKMVKVPCGEK